MAACCYFEVDPRNQIGHVFLSHLTDGTAQFSSALLFRSLIDPFIGQFILSPTLFLAFTPLDKIILNPSSFSALSLLGQIIRCPMLLPSLTLRTKLFLVQILFPFRSFGQTNFRVTFILTNENLLFLLTDFILLPLESKQCPLAPDSVPACAKSVDENRFRSWSES